MAKSRRRGGVHQDPKKPQPETLPADSIPTENPRNIPSLGPRPRISSTGTTVYQV